VLNPRQLSRWRSRAMFSLAPLPLSFFLGACAPETGSPPEDAGFTRVDSAGVTVVESAEPAWADGEAWTLTQDPTLSIGAVDGPEEYILYRTVSPIRLDDGRILFSDAGAQRLRFYDEQGVFLGSSGADGEGPGEFRSPGFIWRLGADSVAVMDFRLLRTSVFDLDGNFGRIIQLEGGPPGLAYPAGMFGDGTFLAQVSIEDDGVYEGETAGTFRDQIQYRRFDRDGQFVDTLVILPGSELYRGAHADGSGGFTTNPHHGLSAHTIVGPSSWFYGSSETFEIQEWSQGGDLSKVIRLARGTRAMPQDVVTEWEERLLEMNSRSRALWGAIPLPDRLPAYEQLLLDRAGNLWVAEYLVLEETPTWQVFAPDGRWLGTVATPADGRIMDIGEDYVLGVWRDEMGVETVRMYGLVKPAARESPGL